jgi:hypothetical protein
LTGLASGTLVVAVVVGATLLTGRAATAAPPTGTLGSLTITPAIGSDTIAPTARTSGPCPTTANAANMLITGPVGVADPTFPPNNPYPIVTFTEISFSTTDPFDLSFELSLQDAATDRGKPLQAGEYDLTAQCIKRLGGGVEGAFTGAMFFTSPTAWQTTDPTGGEGPAATTTTLTTSPGGPVETGTEVTLNAAVTPVGALGSVQFKDGDTDIGGPVAVSSGTASTTTSTLSAGTHQLTAVFMPTDSTTFDASTSSAVSFVVGDVGPEPGPGGEKLLETIITQVTAGLQTLIQFLQLLLQSIIGALQLPVSPR